MNSGFTHTWQQAVSWLREQPDKQELVRHCYYDDPLSAAAERFSNSEEWHAVKYLLRKSLPGKVLDLGAGRGIASYAFAKAGCKVIAVDPDSSSLVGTKAIESLGTITNLPIEVVQGHGEALPFCDSSFDIVYGRAVLHHAQNLQGLCKEAARTLKVGGVFIATREHVISRKKDLQRFLDSHPLHFVYGGENAYLLREYVDAIRASGLRLKKVMGPYESAINYAPMSKHEVAEIIASMLAHVGLRSARCLAATKIAQRFFGWRLSQMSDTPGRHYSFIAGKK